VKLSLTSKKFGKYLIRTRQALGISQLDLSRRLKFSAQFLGRIEKGEVPMPPDALVMAIHILSLDKRQIEAIFVGEFRRKLKELIRLRPTGTE